MSIGAHIWKASSAAVRPANTCMKTRLNWCCDIVIYLLYSDLVLLYSGVVLLYSDVVLLYSDIVLLYSDVGIYSDISFAHK